MYLIVDNAGAKYATYNVWMASLCERACKSGLAITIWWGNGWYYRDVQHVHLQEPTACPTA